MKDEKAHVPRKNRTEPKEKRRLQLIQATMRSIASHSLSETTVSTVSNEAGLSRGAGLRMAIRNGFSRATRTIVDANVTTLITAIVIYKIAPDNVKGFGVTLILGILMSMYTAIFVSRVVFDVAERTKRLKALGMRQLIGHTNFDLLGKRAIAGIFSLVLIAIGLVGIWNRGKDLLNIDFTGGSSVTMVLEENQPMSYTEVKDTLVETALVDKNLSLVEVGITHTQ